MAKTLLFTGSCNRALPYFDSANGNGIAGFWLDEATGAVTPASGAEAIDNPTYIAASRDGRQLFATSEVLGWNEGLVTVYDIDHEAGALRYVNKVASRGDIAAQLEVDGTDGYVTCCNYTVLPMDVRPNVSVAVFKRLPGGELSPAVCQIQHQGQGPDPARQERPHAHCLRFTADNRLALVADLGTDRVEIYRFDALAGSLTHAGAVTLPPGSGPRHIALHPSRPIAYTVNELGSTVATIALDLEAATGTCLALHATVPEAALGHNHCSAIKLAKDGRHLYAGNRGHDSIAIFAIDGETGIAALQANMPCGGATPRDLAFSNSGKVLAVANQDSDNIAVFSHGSDGSLTPLGAGISTGTPTCIAFVG